ncbi:MAG: type II toxin-antitoxin system PemK/MazF family toxin [Spirochaetaceae bacterium]|nr:type II toxin-antitoxin system PemK/MazF family toxin [Spirochaetaceae bacterium]
MTRGEIWWADLGVPFGSEPGFRRPVLVVQADSFNRSRIGSVLCVPFTTNPSLADAPGNVCLDAIESQLSKDSVIVVSQLTCIDRARLVQQAGTLKPQHLAEVEAGIRLVLAL